MNGIIAAHIAVEAMRDQFTYDDKGRPQAATRRTVRRDGFARAFQSLVARLARRNQAASQEASGAH